MGKGSKQGVVRPGERTIRGNDSQVWLEIHTLYWGLHRGRTLKDREQ